MLAGPSLRRGEPARQFVEARRNCRQFRVKRRGSHPGHRWPEVVQASRFGPPGRSRTVSLGRLAGRLCTGPMSPPRRPAMSPDIPGQRPSARRSRQAVKLTSRACLDMTGVEVGAESRVFDISGHLTAHGPGQAPAPLLRAAAIFGSTSTGFSGSPALKRFRRHRAAFRHGPKLIDVLAGDRSPAERPGPHHRA